MRILALLTAALLAAACGAPADDDALAPGSPPAEQPSPTEGPMLLQDPPADVSGPFYSARTDGPRALVVTFTGAPEGDGPCGVAEYLGRLEPAGDELRLLVEPRYTGTQPSGDTVCSAIGAGRQLRAELDEPIGGRRVVDERGHPVHLVDGDQLLRFGALPHGWVEGPEGQAVSGPVHWSFTLRGPDEAHGELRQGTTQLAEAGPKAFGYREISRPTVRGVEAVLVSYDEEPSGNHILRWVEGDRGFALQVMGPLPAPEAMIQIANDLRMSGMPSGS